MKNQWFLTILFASPLCFNKRDRAAAVAGQKSVCGLRFHRPRVRPKNSNLIEKKVSRRTVITKKTKGLAARGGSIDPRHGWQHKSSRRAAIEQVFVEIFCFDRAAADFVMVIDLTGQQNA